MKIDLFLKENTIYLKMLMALVITFWLISTYESLNIHFIDNSFTHLFQILLIKWINDFWAVVLIGFILYPLFYYSKYLISKKNHWIVHLTLIILILSNYSLVEYTLTTLLNLGADFLGYSVNDMLSTVGNSESFTFSSLLPIIFWPIVYFGTFKFLKSKTVETPKPSKTLIVIGVFIISKVLISSFSDKNLENKIVFLFSDIMKSKLDFYHVNANRDMNRNDYPLLRDANEIPDVLSTYIPIGEKKPNIVVIVLESLGSEFVNGNEYSGFMPYLDSIIDKSLYWENFVSNTGRSFGILPSLFGSLPYGEKGFLELTDTPSHLSLLSILKGNGYKTTYISGGPSQFDRKVNFLEYNSIDRLVDEKLYNKDFKKTDVDGNGFSWGYPDEEIYKMALMEMQDTIKPRLDVIMTLSNHEPFIYPNQEAYEQDAEQRIEKLEKTEQTKAQLLHHKNIIGCLMYTDDALKKFITAYKASKDFENTIFIITGDHRLIPMAQKDKLCRFHVPFMIYSPKLEKGQKFKGISSHWDVTPSLIKYLSANYKFKPIQEIAWMGNGLDTSKVFRGEKFIPLMRYKGSINDGIYKDYFYSDGELFKITEKFETYETSDGFALKEVNDTLFEFKKINAYITENKRLYPDSLNVYVNRKKYFSKEELTTIKHYANGKTYDQLLLIARDLAFEKNYEEASLLCEYILNEYPNYTDAILLKGRIYAWQRNFKMAELTFNNALKRDPYYFDIYLALLDMYWWSNQESKSEALYNSALQNQVVNPEISVKMFNYFNRNNKPEKANQLLDSLITVYPNEAAYKSLKADVK